MTSQTLSLSEAEALGPIARGRRPRGYVGKDHLTIGSDIQAVMASLNNPRTVLSPDQLEKLDGLSADGWYPIRDLIALMEVLDARLGAAGLRRLGRTLFKMSHEDRVKPLIQSARALVEGLDGMYHHANRGGQIGGWKVTQFEPGRAEMDKTTPHHCVMEEGILLQAFSMLGIPVTITQSECFRQGGELCHYVLTAPETGTVWTG